MSLIDRLFCRAKRQQEIRARARVNNERRIREGLGLRDEAAARAVLEQFFVKIDRNGDDHLSLEELVAVFGERRAHLMLRYSIYK